MSNEGSVPLWHRKHTNIIHLFPFSCTSAYPVWNYWRKKQQQLLASHGDHSITSFSSLLASLSQFSAVIGAIILCVFLIEEWWPFGSPSIESPCRQNKPKWTSKRHSLPEHYWNCFMPEIMQVSNPLAGQRCSLWWKNKICLTRTALYGHKKKAK